MRIIKNWIGRVAVFPLIFSGLLTGCTPAGPRALLDGKALLESGEPVEAVRRLETAVSLLQTNAMAWNYLGLAYHHAGQFTNALQAYARAARLDKDLAEVHFNLGCLWMGQERTDAARNEFTAYTLARPTDPIGWLKLGSAQRRLGEPAAAEKSLREAYRLNSSDPEPLNELGLSELQRNRPREAAQCFSSALQVSPRYGPAILNLAVVLHRYFNDRPRALEKYREYLALPDRGANWGEVNAVARALQSELAPPPEVSGSSPKVTEPAVPPIQSRTAAEPVRPSAQARVDAPQLVEARPAVTTSRPSSEPTTSTKPPSSRAPVRAAEPTRPAMTDSPSRPAEVELEVVKVSPPIPVVPVRDLKLTTNVPPVRSQRVEENAQAPQQTVEQRGFLSRINPINLFRRQKPEANSAESSSRTQAGRSSGSTGAFVRYAYRNPRKPAPGDRSAAEKHFARGALAHAEFRFKEGISEYREATRLDPAYYEAWFNLGLASAKVGDLAEALAAFEMGLALQPESSDARYSFALALKQGNYILDAANELKRLLAADPKDTRGHLMLGNICAQQLGMPDEAEAHYRKVLELDPKNSQAANIRFWLSSRQH